MSDISNFQRGQGDTRTALITGATGRIGQDLSRRLAQVGYRVALVGRDINKLKVVIAQLSQVHAGPHVAIVADLRQSESGATAVQRAIAELGRVGLFVHLACPPIVNETALYDAQYCSSMMRVGYESFMEAASVLLPHMLPAQQGCIAGFLSEAIKTPVVSSWSGYVAAKMALMGALMSVAQHCRNTGVSCVGIAPGALDYEDNPIPAGVTRERQVRLDPDYFLDLVLDDLDGSSVVDNGSYHFISTTGQHIAPMTGLAAPVVIEKLVALAPNATGTTVTTAPTPTATPAPAANDAVMETLSQTFRRVFGLSLEVDVRVLGTHNLKNWDSLGQLKLLMEIEQALEIRIPTDRIESITTFEDLYQAVIDALH